MRQTPKIDFYRSPSLCFLDYTVSRFTPLHMRYSSRLLQHAADQPPPVLDRRNPPTSNTLHPPLSPPPSPLNDPTTSGEKSRIPCLSTITSVYLLMLNLRSDAQRYLFVGGSSEMNALFPLWPRPSRSSVEGGYRPTHKVTYCCFRLVACRSLLDIKWSLSA